MSITLGALLRPLLNYFVIRRRRLLLYRLVHIMVKIVVRGLTRVVAESVLKFAQFRVHRVVGGVYGEAGVRSAYGDGGGARRAVLIGRTVVA